MLKSFLFYLFFGVGLCSAEFAAGAAESEIKAYWLCKNKKEVRTIRVEIDARAICHTLYSKKGEEKDVGSGSNHDSCVSFLNNIKINLEKSHWACRDITDTKITADLG